MRDHLVTTTAILIIAIFTIAMIEAAIHINERNNDCQASGGLTVKTLDGWQCLDVKKKQ